MKLSRERMGVLLALGLGFVLAGCAAHHYSTSQDYAPQASMPTSMPVASSVTSDASSVTRHSVEGARMASRRAAPAPMLAGERADGEEKGGSDKGKMTLVALHDSQPDRFLIRNATVNIETEEVHKAAEALVVYARASHGYVSDSHETVDGLGAHSITMTLRVPATQFEASLKEMETQGKILDKQVTTEDVTEEFVDSTARLRNLKSTELRLLEHLSKTGKLSDTLLVETEITRVRQEIEQIEGRLKFLAHRIAYSTFTLTIHETPKLQSIVPPQTFSTGKVASDATRSLVEFSQNIWSMLIWLGVWSLLWFPLIVLVRWLVIKRLSGGKSTKQGELKIPTREDLRGGLREE